jgi:hypothetical protein
MNWLNTNASAVQALATIASLIVTLVLAVLTAKYVRLTRRIADVALEQMQHIKLTRTTAQKQAARSLDALSRRIRIPLEKLDPAAPSHRQLREYNLLSQEDISALETLARDVNDQAVLYAGKVAVSLRKIFGLINEARGVNQSLGWAASGTQTTQWKEAMEAGPTMLAELEKVRRDVAEIGN